MLIVSDSSPLISLAILDLLEILDVLFEKVYVPESVFQEVTKGDKPHSNKLKVYLENKVKKVNDQLSVDILKNDIDVGEAESIVLALEIGIQDVLMDDYKGRMKATLNGLTPIGVIGILIRAKQKGIIQNLKPLLDVLIENKRRVSEQLYNHALQIVNEG